MSQRKNTGYADGQWSLVAGHLNGGESVAEAAAREALEEAAIAVPRNSITTVGVMHRRSDLERVEFFASSFRWFGTIINAEPQKCACLEWHPASRLPSNTIPYIRVAIDLSARRPNNAGAWFAEPDFAGGESSNV